MPIVTFYRASDKPYGAFSNLARFSVTLNGRRFPTAEHAYQYAKPRDPKVREWLMAAPSPALLAKTAHQLTRPWEVMPGWSARKVDRMRTVLEAKFMQHHILEVLLRSTGGFTIVENGTIDDDAGRFWGCVHKKPLEGCTCKNTLGKLLMELRDDFRDMKYQS